MPTYTWDIVHVECSNSVGLTNVIETVHWKYTGIDGDLTYSAFGFVKLDPVVNPESFIEFSNLTTAQVSSWVEEKLGVSQVEGYRDSINHHLSLIVAPPAIQTLPDYIPAATATDQP